MSEVRTASKTQSGDSPDDRIRVMVVDDALVIRGMLSRLIEETTDMTVVASVGDGERALKSLERHEIDVVVLDIEMPRMDGLTALPKIKKLSPVTEVLMASTLTLRNAEISMKAMSLGAADYIPKPSSSGEIRGATDFRHEFVAKVRALGKAARRKRGLGSTSAPQRAFRADRGAAPSALAPKKPIVLRPAKSIRPNVLAIGSSTGGPQALLKVLGDIGSDFRLPILVTQHMPPTFTTILAQHTAKASGLPCKEAADGETVEPGHIYIAPGDFHMTVEPAGAKVVLRLNQDAPENFCRPAVDPMLRSIVEVYGGRVLTVILTGMGADGRKGCQSIVDAGGVVVGQDEATSVVWGMPGAVANAGLCTAVLPLEEIGQHVRRVVAGAVA